ncbi:hypothetical protein [Microbacterium aurantiacum]|uniref:ABC transporter permease n=1 Tax=Microbacterium aurantiacum TaxID=162393 RepID=A0ABT8FSK6_9MICO|nr:hypothetical protein [Microbacterium aurantiacum]MDN4463882.1 hypothetical protein [Microbacterium aurantiacum]
MTRRNIQHAGPRPHRSWWRGPVLPATLLVIAAAALVWELSWALPLLTGGQP